MKALSDVSCFAAAVLVALTVCSRAGFNIPRHNITAVPIGGSQADKEIMEFADSRGSDYPPIDEPVPAADMQTLMSHPPFAGKTPAEIRAKVIHIRRAVLCAIDLVRREDPRVADGLLDLFRSGKICIGLKPEGYNVTAEILADGKTQFNSEPINIYLLPCTRLTLASPDLFLIANSLAHEGLHGIQDSRPWRDGQTLLDAKAIHCNELAASEGELARVIEMLRVLDSIENTGRLPADAHGMTATIGAGIIQEFAGKPGLAARIREFRDMLVKIRTKTEQVAGFRRLYKRAAELAIAGSPDIPAVLKGLREHGLFQFFATENEFAPITRFYTSQAPQIVEQPGQPPKVEGTPTMRQLAPPDLTPHDFICPFLDTISDAAVIGNYIYIGGVSHAGNSGIVVRAGIGADGFIVPGSAQKSLESPALANGFDVAFNPFDEKIYVTNLTTGAVYRLNDANSDGLFEDAPLYGAFAGLPSNNVALNFDTFFADRDTLIMRALDMAAYRLPDEPVYTAARNGVDPFFMPVPEEAFYNFFTTAPAIEMRLFPGSDVLALSGTPDAPFTVRTAGLNPVTLFSGNLSPLGREIVRIPAWDGVSPVLAEFSGVSLSASSARPPILPALEIDGANGDDAVSLTALAAPGSLVTFNQLTPGSPPVRLPIRPAENTDLDGKLVSPVPRDRLFLTYNYFDASVSAPVLPLTAGTPGSFSATPGLRNIFDLTLNDGVLPPGTFFEIGQPPPLPPSLFHLYGDGIAVTIPRTASGPMSFTYHIGLNGGFSSTYTEILGRTVTELTDPAVIHTELGDFVSPWMLPLADGGYPLYQFNFAYNIADNCGLPHWHANVTVFHFGGPPGKTDPNSTGCGFGSYPPLYPFQTLIPADLWDEFRQAHP